MENGSRDTSVRDRIGKWFSNFFQALNLKRGFLWCRTHIAAILCVGIILTNGLYKVWPALSIPDETIAELAGDAVGMQGTIYAVKERVSDAGLGVLWGAP